MRVFWRHSLKSYMATNEISWCSSEIIGMINQFTPRKSTSVLINPRNSFSRRGRAQIVFQLSVFEYNDANKVMKALCSNFTPESQLNFIQLDDISVLDFQAQKRFCRF
jgi:hypothetical protein